MAEEEEVGGVDLDTGKIAGTLRQFLASLENRTPEIVFFEKITADPPSFLKEQILELEKTFQSLEVAATGTFSRKTARTRRSVVTDNQEQSRVPGKDNPFDKILAEFRKVVLDGLLSTLPLPKSLASKISSLGAEEWLAMFLDNLYGTNLDLASFLSSLNLRPDGVPNIAASGVHIDTESLGQIKQAMVSTIVGLATQSKSLKRMAGSSSSQVMESTYLKEGLALLDTSKFPELDILKAMVLSGSLPAPVEALFAQAEDLLKDKLALEITLMKLGADDLKSMEKLTASLKDLFYSQIMNGALEKLPLPTMFRSKLLEVMQNLGLGSAFFEELSEEFDTPLPEMLLSLWKADAQTLQTLSGGFMNAGDRMIDAHCGDLIFFQSVITATGSSRPELQTLLKLIQNDNLPAPVKLLLSQAQEFLKKEIQTQLNMQPEKALETIKSQDSTKLQNLVISSFYEYIFKAAMEQISLPPAIQSNITKALRDPENQEMAAIFFSELETFLGPIPNVVSDIYAEKADAGKLVNAFVRASSKALESKYSDCDLKFLEGVITTIGGSRPELLTLLNLIQNDALPTPAKILLSQAQDYLKNEIKTQLNIDPDKALEFIQNQDASKMQDLVIACFYEYVFGTALEQIELPSAVRSQVMEVLQDKQNQAMAALFFTELEKSLGQPLPEVVSDIYSEKADTGKLVQAFVAAGTKILESQYSGKDSFIKDLVKSLDHTQLGLRPELVIFFGLFKADKLPLPLEIVLQKVEEHVEKEIKKKFPDLAVDELKKLILKDDSNDMKQLLVDTFYEYVVNQALEKVPIPSMIKTQIVDYLSGDLGQVFFEELDVALENRSIPDLLSELWETKDTAALQGIAQHFMKAGQRVMTVKLEKMAEGAETGFDLLSQMIKMLMHAEHELERRLGKEINQTDCLELLLPLLADPQMPVPIRLMLRQLEAQVEVHLMQNFPDIDLKNLEDFPMIDHLDEFNAVIIEGFKELLMDNILNILPISPHLKTFIGDHVDTYTPVLIENLNKASQGDKPDDIVELVRDIMEGNADEALEALVIIFTEELEENESEVVDQIGDKLADYIRKAAEEDENGLCDMLCGWAKIHIFLRIGALIGFALLLAVWACIFAFFVTTIVFCCLTCFQVEFITKALFVTMLVNSIMWALTKGVFCIFVDPVTGGLGTIASILSSVKSVGVFQGYITQVDWIESELDLDEYTDWIVGVIVDILQFAGVFDEIKKAFIQGPEEDPEKPKEQKPKVSFRANSTMNVLPPRSSMSKPSPGSLRSYSSKSYIGGVSMV